MLSVIFYVVSRKLTYLAKAFLTQDHLQTLPVSLLNQNPAKHRRSDYDNRSGANQVHKRGL